MVIDFFNESFDSETKKCIEDFICNLCKVNGGLAKQILRDIRYKNDVKTIEDVDKVYNDYPILQSFFQNKFHFMFETYALDKVENILRTITREEDLETLYKYDKERFEKYVEEDMFFSSLYYDNRVLLFYLKKKFGDKMNYRDIFKFIKKDENLRFKDGVDYIGDRAKICREMYINFPELFNNLTIDDAKVDIFLYTTICEKKNIKPSFVDLCNTLKIEPTIVNYARCYYLIGPSVIKQKIIKKALCNPSLTINSIEDCDVENITEYPIKNINNNRFAIVNEEETGCLKITFNKETLNSCNVWISIASLKDVSDKVELIFNIEYKDNNVLKQDKLIARLNADEQCCCYSNFIDLNNLSLQQNIKGEYIFQQDIKSIKFISDENGCILEINNDEQNRFLLNCYKDGGSYYSDSVDIEFNTPYGDLRVHLCDVKDV